MHHLRDSFEFLPHELIFADSDPTLNLRDRLATVSNENTQRWQIILPI